MLQRVKNKTSTTRLRLMSYILFFTRCDVICDLLQYTRTGKCNLFVKLMLDYLYTVLMLANITKKVTKLQYTVCFNQKFQITKLTIQYTVYFYYKLLICNKRYRAHWVCLVIKKLARVRLGLNIFCTGNILSLFHYSLNSFLDFF